MITYWKLNDFLIEFQEEVRLSILVVIPSRLPGAKNVENILRGVKFKFDGLIRLKDIGFSASKQ